MMNLNEKKWKKSLDNLLILNLLILIIGAFFLLISFILSVNGNSYLFNIFQKLWYPLFIPALSLFFTAILIEATYTYLIDKKSK
tara:strand:+ start:1217 stop:1468 length:252 start_codon:yes stop_codon:yes gene_type:complete